MFTTGQLVFAGIFFIVFVGIIIYTYRKDLKLHQKYYKGTLYVFIAFLLFVALLFVLKGFLKD